MRSLLKVSLGTILAGAFSASVIAAPATPAACDSAASVFDPAYDACVGAYEGTDVGAKGLADGILNAGDAFGAEDWTFLGKDDGLGDTFFDVLDSTGTSSGIGETEGKIVFDLVAIEAAYGSSFLDDYDLAVSFKAAKAFSIYMWESPVWAGSSLTAPPTILWDVTVTDKTPDLSHSSVWFRKTDPSTPPTPPISTVSESSPLALLTLGLLGLASWSRKRKA